MSNGKKKNLQLLEKLKLKLGANLLARNGFRAIAPSMYVENEIKRITTLNENQRQFWKDFQQYLINEREARINDILGAIDSTKSEKFESSFGRIVSSKFAQDPLNGSGSVIVPPGGRFNLAKSSSYSNFFIGLYLAEDYDTAFAEKFHCSNESQTEAELIDFGLRPNESFSFNRVSVKIEKYIDLTNDETLEAFIESIKDIKIPPYFYLTGKGLGIQVSLLTDAKILRQSFFSEDYPLWAAWLDQPAPSQFFGHYCRLAGVQGILYPSVRNNKNNIVLFPENFNESNSIVELTDDVPYVPNERKKICKDNFQTFMYL